MPPARIQTLQCVGVGYDPGVPLHQPERFSSVVESVSLPPVVVRWSLFELSGSRALSAGADGFGRGSVLTGPEPDRHLTVAVQAAAPEDWAPGSRPLAVSTDV